LRLRLAHQPVDRRPHPAAGPVQQHALIFGGDAEQGTGLLRAAILDIAQNDDRLLAGRQKLDRLPHMHPELPSGDQALRVQHVPQRGDLLPMPVRLELPGLHRPLHPIEPRQRHGAALGGDAGTGAVHHDGEDPAGQARSAFEPVDAAKHRQPGILHHLLRLGAAADDALRHPHQRRVIAADQPPIGRLIAVAQQRQELRRVKLAVITRHGILPVHMMSHYPMCRVRPHTQVSPDRDDIAEGE
jgi:hypothetical protein